MQQHVTVEDLSSDKEYQLLSESIKKVIEFIRQQALTVAY